jgi:hypothetical protein
MTQTAQPSTVLNDLTFAFAHVLSDSLRGLPAAEYKATARANHIVAKDCAEQLRACASDAERIALLRQWIAVSR